MIPDDYKMQYTWWMDYSIADKFGMKAVQDTYDRSFKEWRDNRVAMQEMTAVLNWKGWEHYNKDNNSELAKLYFRLWEECYNKCLDHFKGEERAAYWEFLD